MKSGIRTFFLLLFAITLVLSAAGVALTYGRYYGEKTSSGNGYVSDIEFIVADQIEVSNVEEFIGAIENGYSNITVSESAEDSILITSEITEVGVDLIINLNGHRLVRNSRDPILKVVDGVRLTIIDSSENKAGSFYNPVGSVLMIDGGTLTVSGGIFESGPRESEYVESRYSFNTLSTKVFEKDENNQYFLKGEYSMPRLPEGQTGVYYVNGLDNNEFVKKDVYIYRYAHNSDENVMIGGDAGSADFYYGYTDAAGNKVTAFGYYDAKGAATSETNFSAVSMKSGNMYVRGGEYHSYFGSAFAYGIYAEGGYMAVEDGVFSVREDGTCIKCNYSNPSESEYLRISSGSFSSEWGDTVQVDGGKLMLTGGEFVKDAESAPSGEEYSAIIRIGNGVLEGSGTENRNLEFMLYGSDLYGIYAEGDGLRVSLSYSRFIFGGDGNAGNTGIYATGGKINVSDSVFSIGSDSSFGIRAEHSATVADSSDVELSGCVFSMTGAASTGVSIMDGSVTLSGTAANKYTLFYIDGVSDCYGVLAGTKPGTGTFSGGAGSIKVNVESAQFFLGQTGYVADGRTSSFNGAGIYTNAENSNITLNDGFFITAGSGSSGVYAEKGSVTQTGEGKKLVIVTGAAYDGYVAGGQADAGWITFPRAAAEYVAGTSLDVTNSDVIGSYGVYTANGSVSLQSAFVAIYSGEACGVYTAGGGNVDAGRLDVDVIIGKNRTNNILSSTAVSTQDGNVDIDYAYINTDSLGITAQGGNVKVSETLELDSARGTAIYVNGGDLTFEKGSTEKESTVNIKSAIDGNCAWGAAGATEPYSYDGIYVQGGSLISYGMNVEHTGVVNDKSQYTGDNGDSLYRDYKIRSYAVRVESSAAADSEVSIPSGEITNSTGGGIYVSAVGDRRVSVSLGDAVSGKGPDISATGKTLYSDDISIAGAASNWTYRISETGGHAVEVSGGKLDIYGGSYKANQGDGVLVRNGTVNIDNGTFSGNDNYLSGYWQNETVAGPAASYSLKMYGGTVNVNGGTFGNGSSGSGAFIMGNVTGDNMANANIYGGTFAVEGQSGFSIFDYANVLFAPSADDVGTEGKLEVAGKACAIAVENRTAAVRIEIRGGEFYSTGDSGNYNGIWYSNPNAELIISGGTFKGSECSGLSFAKSPYSDKVSISGGTFISSSSDYKPIRLENGYLNENDILETGYEFDKSVANQWTARRA